MSKNTTIKRVYEPAAKGDGARVLIDRVWPRGMTREAAALDLWLKAVAPSTELRKWFAHDPARWDEFRKRYGKELDEHAEPVEELRGLMAKGPVTLLYSARDA